MSGQLLDPEVLAKVSGLTLQARIVVDGLVTGLHRSPIRGRDVEFAEHREYSPGDELRHIDWKVYARSGRYYVKRFEQETNAKVQVVVDCSRSMLVNTRGVSKLEYARRLAASMSYLLLRQGDSVGLALFDDRIRARVGGQGHVEHMAEISEALVRAEPGPDTDISRSLAELAGMLPRRQVLILISDLIDEPDKVIEAVNHLNTRRHDVLVFQVLDPEEIRFDFHGGVRLRDLESGRIMELDADQARNLYRHEAQRLIGQYELRFRQKAIDYHLMETTNDLAQALVRVLSRRAELSARV
jgi:uncharacterized protein (DUF58 family)